MARPRITVDEEALEHLIGLGVSIGLAADIMEVSESTIARHLKRNPEAHKRMTAARTRLRTRLIAEMVRRGLKSSDRLLLASVERLAGLKSHALEISGPNGGPIGLHHNADVSSEIMTEASELLKQIQEAARNRDGDPSSTEVE
ncbi:hypothetical protein Gbfr_002_006 [Gluconobacter frateurii M-2]|nr:hypothetical protein Gbfr_002_006 [Gluconobacter frateurii M-2]